MSFALIGAFVANLPSLLLHKEVSSHSLMHHFDVRVIGLFLIAWVAIFLVGIILWTPFVARLGPAVVMRRAVPGGWLTMIALLAINHLPLVGMLVVLPLLVLGILWLAGFGPAAVTYLADCSESLSADRSALMSFYTVALAGGGAIGAVIGGFAAHLLYIDGLVILGLLLSGTTFITLGAVVRSIQDRVSKAAARWSEPGRYQAQASGAVPGPGNRASRRLERSGRRGERRARAGCSGTARWSADRRSVQ